MTETQTRVSHYFDHQGGWLNIYTCPENHIATADIRITSHNPGNGEYELYLGDDKYFDYFHYIACWQRILSGQKHHHRSIIMGPGQAMATWIQPDEIGHAISLQATIITRATT